MQTYYDEWGQRKIILDKVNPIHFLKRFLLMREIMKLRKHIKYICEIGCGVGLLSNRLGRKGFIVEGYDIDKKAIELAKKNKSKNTAFFTKDVLKIGKKHYDAVISNAMLEHIKDDKRAIKCFYNSLNTNGYLFLIVPINMKYWTLHDKQWGHFRRYEKKELIKKLESVGFKIKKIRYHIYPTLKWFYFNVYLSAVKKKKRIIKKKKVPLYYYLLFLVRYIFLIDYFFNSKKAINILVIAKK